MSFLINTWQGNRKIKLINWWEVLSEIHWTIKKPINYNVTDQGHDKFYFGIYHVNHYNFNILWNPIGRNENFAWFITGLNCMYFKQTWSTYSKIHSDLWKLSYHTSDCYYRPFTVWPSHLFDTVSLTVLDWTMWVVSKFLMI